MAITFETLNELIMDARDAREKAELELARALATVEELRRRQQQLREEEDAYVATLTRRFPDAQTGLAPISEDSFETGVDVAAPTEWAAMPRTTAVERAIAELTKTKDTASPADIEMLLRTNGRSDGRDEIGGAIAHLNRTGKIQRVGRAQWVLRDEI